MTNRLHILEQEREQLEQALADDPHWQAFCEAQRRAATAGPAPQLSPEVLAGLTRSKPFAAYMEVVREIDRIKAAEPEPQTATEIAPDPTPIPEQAPQPPQRVDDLTAIRRIDRALEKQLNGIGLYTYQAIAGWDRHQVRAVRDALQLGKRAWRENWIEQAALLHLRQASQVQPEAAPAAVTVEPSKPPPATAPQIETESETPAPDTISLAPVDEPLAPDDTTTATPSDVAPAPTEDPTVDEPPPATAEPIAPSQDVPPPPSTFKVGRRPQRLPAPAARRFSYLFGVTDDLSEALRSAGVRSLAEISEWTRSDVKWFQAMLGDDARISRDQWIEQATLLARGQWTRHALRVVSGETRLVVPRPPPPADLHVAPRSEPQPETVEATQDAGPPPLPTEPPVPAESTSDQPTPADPSLQEELLESVLAPPDSIAAPKPPPPPSPDTTAVGPPALPTADPSDEPTAAPTPAEPISSPPAEKLIGRINRPPPDLGSREPPEQSTEPTPHPPEPSRFPPPSPAFTALTASLQRPPPPSSEATERPSAAENRPAAEPSEAATVPAIRDEEDWSDAEALVVKRAETPDPGPQPRETAPQEAQSPAPPAAADDAHPPASGAPVPPQSDEAVLSDAPVWGDEAEVVIVTRDRGAPDTPRQHQAPAREAPAASVPTERQAPRVHHFDEDHVDTAQTGYGNAAEEASVTIIRAEASQEDAATVVPNDIANDADAPQSAKPKGGARALGSRFLKALTGN